MKREIKENDEEVKIDKEKEVKLKKLLCKFLTAEEELEKATSSYNELKSLMTKAFKSLSIKSYAVESNNDSKGKIKTSFTLAKRINVFYDVPKMRKVLGDKTVNKIVSKEYSISDYEMFKEIMKKYKVPADTIRKCIDVKETINTSKLQNLVESEVIDLKKIKECYTLNITEYISRKSSSK